LVEDTAVWPPGYTKDHCRGEAAVESFLSARLSPLEITPVASGRIPLISICLFFELSDSETVFRRRAEVDVF
jgi:hypothetical protein